MKDLVRTRHQIDVYYTMGSQLKAMSMKLGTIKATADISTALKLATKTMTHVNEKMSIKEIQQVMKEFAKQQMKMEAGQDAVTLIYLFFLDGRSY